MAYGTANVDVIQSSTANVPVQFKDGNGTQVGTLCRAWVNFNGTGTVAIRASFNVSSITDNGTGYYTLNFTNSLPDANYCLSGMTRSAGRMVSLTGTLSTSSASIYTANDAGNLEDLDTVTVALFR